ncbi:MAG TPA: lipoyl synthase [Chitinispirillaceae bacterium]|nr:lipoyl synthase [Chitinispirillaceae bacterium]
MLQEISQKPRRLPPWLKRQIAHSGKQSVVKKFVHNPGLHTVCQEAKCPNRGECYSKGIATFLILGNICTRNCSFCNISHGSPKPLDKTEPVKLLNAAQNMNLRHIVITSVTRDDLQDGGAGVFAEIVNLLRKQMPSVSVELLVPDFLGDSSAIDTVLSNRPDVFNHNIETVPELYSKIRPQADYKRSLFVLNRAASKGLVVKSGFMVGFGENESQITDVMKDLHQNGCTILTIGQYLQPSSGHTPVVKFIEPEKFEYFKQLAKNIGFKSVFSGPYVRSSYRAAELLHNQISGT